MKKFFTIILIIVAGALVIFGGIKLGEFITKKNISVMNMPDSDFLPYESPWQREDNPSIIWVFNEDGTGKVTSVNGLESFDMEWKTQGGELTIKTKWITDIEDKWKLTTDREALTLTVTDPKNEEVSYKFVRHIEEKEDEAETEGNTENTETNESQESNDESTEENN